MREIEIKVRVNDPQKLLATLEQQGVALGAPKKQHDVVYGLIGDGNFKHGDNWLRVRTEDESKIYFTLKRSVTGELDSIEHEIVVDNADELTAIIKNLGYELYSDLTKIRRKARQGDIEICFDEVPGLGTFIEAEKLSPDDADYDSVVTELWALLKSFGLEKSDQVTSGYDVLLRESQGIAR